MTKNNAIEVFVLAREQFDCIQRANYKFKKLGINAAVNPYMNELYIHPREKFEEFCEALGVKYAEDVTTYEGGMSTTYLKARYGGLTVKCLIGATLTRRDEDDADGEND